MTALIPLSGGRFAVPVKAADLPLLKDLPGAYINEQAMRVEGRADVVAAATARLGGEIAIHHGSRPVENLPADLRPYQREGVAQTLAALKRYGGALLADEMGLGKTRQAIEVSRLVGGRRLVIAPGAVRETWRDDLSKWGETSTAVLGPRTTKKKQAEWEAARTAQWVVTSYEMAQEAFDVAFGRRAPDLLVIDEAHMVSGRKAIRSQTLQQLGVMARYRLALTGTPIWDRPRNLHQLLKVLLGDAFGTAFQFDQAYCAGFINSHGGMDNRGASRTDELRSRLSYYMVRRLKSDVLTELPPLTRQVMWIESVPKALKAFETFALRIPGYTIADALNATLEGKMPEAIRLASELKQFVLFTWQKKHAAQMADKLTAAHDTPCYAVTGDMSVETRQAVIRRAAAERAGVVCTIDSVGTGVDALKHVAQTAIVHAIPYVGALAAQAEARLHRMGQTGAVQIIYLAMKDSADQLVVRTVVEKLAQTTAVVGGESSMEAALNEKDNGATETEAMDAIYAELMTREVADEEMDDE